MWYNIDFRRLTLLLLPSFLRTERMRAWFYTLISPLQPLHDDFLRNRKDNLTKLNHNSQVCYLRKILNDTFDPDRRIQILPASSLQQIYIYTNAEYKINYLGKIHLHQPDDFSDKGVDFIVKIPTELKDYTEEIYAVTVYYKLASKRFKIVIDDNI